MSNKLLQKMFGIFQHFRNIVSSKHWVYVTYCLTPSHNTNQRTKHRLLICQIPSRISVMFYKTKKKGRFCHNRCTLCTLWYDTSIVDWVVYKNLCGFFFQQSLGILVFAENWHIWPSSLVDCLSTQITAQLNMQFTEFCFKKYRWWLIDESFAVFINVRKNNVRARVA